MRKSLLAGAAALALFPAAAIAGNFHDVGTWVWESSGPACYKGHLAESGLSYAVVYTISPTGFPSPTASDVIAMNTWVDNLKPGAFVDVVTTSEEPVPVPNCGTGKFLMVNGVRSGAVPIE